MPANTELQTLVCSNLITISQKKQRLANFSINRQLLHYANIQDKATV